MSLKIPLVQQRMLKHAEASRYTYANASADKSSFYALAMADRMIGKDAVNGALQNGLDETQDHNGIMGCHCR